MISAVSFKENYLLLLCFFIFLSVCFGDLNADVLNLRATVALLFTFNCFYLFIYWCFESSLAVAFI